MKVIIYTIGLVFLTIAAKAQVPDINFIGEGQKNSIKLFWLPSVWPDGAEGFNVKRRGDNDRIWTQINSTVILPGNFVTKDLANIEKDKKALQDLMAKRELYIKGISAPIAIKINEITTDYIYKTGKDSSYFIGTSLLISQDYDLAKLFGFAMEDRDIPVAKKYEYGLFVKYFNGEEKLIKSIEWIYGTTPEVILKIETFKKASRNKKSIELQWVFNYNDYKKHPTISGFNMYKKEKGKLYEKLNKNRIWVSSNDSVAKIVYVDKSLKDSIEYTYAIVPVTIFNSEAQYVEISYSPVSVPAEYLPLTLIKDSISGAVNFSWAFDKNNERFINGFKILRSLGSLSKFDSIMFVGPTIRSYYDKVLPKTTRYTYNYKIIAVLNKPYDDVESNIVSFFTPPQPSAPINFNAALTKEDGKEVVLLKWDTTSTDTIKTMYKVYVTDRNTEGPSPLLYGSYLEPTTETQINYKYVSAGNRYGFAVSAIYDIFGIKIESDKSNIAFITIPTGNINRLQFSSVTLNANKSVTFSWVYNSDSYPDMKGFRIYDNDRLLIDENNLSKDTRSFSTQVLSTGIYRFQITAVTNSGVESEKMPIWTINVK